MSIHIYKQTNIPNFHCGTPDSVSLAFNCGTPDSVSLAFNCGTPDSVSLAFNCGTPDSVSLASLANNTVRSTIISYGYYISGVLYLVRVPTRTLVHYLFAIGIFIDASPSFCINTRSPRSRTKVLVSFQAIQRLRTIFVFFICQLPFVNAGKCHDETTPGNSYDYVSTITRHFFCKMSSGRVPLSALRLLIPHFGFRGEGVAYLLSVAGGGVYCNGSVAECGSDS